MGDIEPGLLPLVTEEACYQSMARWSSLALEAQRLDSAVHSTCNAERLAENVERLATLAGQAERLGVGDLTLPDLQRAHADAQKRASELARALKIISQVLVVTDRRAAEGPDLKAEAVAVSFLHQVSKFPFQLAHFRSSRLSQDGVLDEIRATQALAKDAIAAARQAQFGEIATPNLAVAIPPARELREAAAILQGTSILGRLFSGKWRNARATWLKTFPAERKILPSSSLRLKAAAQWKEKLEQLEFCVTVKEAIGRNWKGVDTAFDSIIGITTWMLSVQKITPLTVPGARELRRVLYEGSSEDVGAWSDLALQAEACNLLVVFHSCYTRQTSVGTEAKIELQRAAELSDIIRVASDCGLRSTATFHALNDAVTSLLSAQESRPRSNRLDTDRALCA
jgi:hypothetical protein